MLIRNKKEPILFFLGDVSLLVLALWLALFARYLTLPSYDLFLLHIIPFSVLIFVWVTIFFIAGLYGKHTQMLKSRLPSIISKAQIVNSIIAVMFFYLIPYFGITPKITLFIYLAISFVFILWWRIYGQALFGFYRRERALIIGSGEEMHELIAEVNNNSRYAFSFVSSVDLNEIGAIDFEGEVVKRIYSENIAVVVMSMHNKKVEPFLPHLYNLMFAHVRFITMHKVYEDIFDRIPFSVLEHSWFLENISLSPRRTYDTMKRAMDIALGFLLGAVSLMLYPLIATAIYFDDKGQVFSFQKRIGQNNRIISLMKFRTMERDDNGEWSPINDNKITRVGSFLRKTRIDELPQLWNVLIGDISLIGPRPEFPQAIKRYAKQIPYYNIRHLIKPGLSGWAQIYHDEHPHHSVDIKETKVKLSYDLFYLKNRSLLLDLKIALKTLRIFASRSGL